MRVAFNKIQESLFCHPRTVVRVRGNLLSAFSEMTNEVDTIEGDTDTLESSDTINSRKTSQMCDIL